MTQSPGQDSGQGFDWGAYVQWLVRRNGSLAATADRLAEQRGHKDSVASIERALRRLRAKGHAEGGVWGRRCLQWFGLPRSVIERVRWMGQYHTRFSDLPVEICQDLLRAWNRPPASNSPARVWIQLGLASVALRREDHALAREHLEAARTATCDPLSMAEWSLVAAFAGIEEDDAMRMRVGEILHTLPPSEDRACLHARWIDQRGYVLNIQRRDHDAAYALYAEIEADGPPFALVRRHNGMGWSALKLGDRARAVSHARCAMRSAGDAGSLRLRAMALRLLSVALGGEEGAEAHARACRIAERLGDETLRLRLDR